jgi:hypothetical protein
MKNYEEVEIGTSPVDEDCTQVSSKDTDYIFWNKLECHILIRQLRRMFPELTDRVRLKVKPNHHEFGVYYEVNAVANYDDEMALDAAWKLQDLLPSKWDEQALQELEEEKHPMYYTKTVQLYRKAN